MRKLKTRPVWKERVKRIPCKVQKLELPNAKDGELDQDQEWCEVTVDGKPRRIRFHDYGRVYEVPGLYERLFYERLKCCSPSRIVRLLEDVLSDAVESTSDLSVLDVGAGNGMVGDELAERNVQRIVGIDIIPEAREATLRDRPEIYDDYLVTDLTDLPEQQEQRLRRHDFNCLTSVAALGFGDIPPAAFLKALDVIGAPGWLAFNIKVDFLHERDTSGFCRLIRQLSRDEYIEPHAYRRYRHRLSVSRKPLYYVAMVARKLKDLPAELMEEWES